MVSIVRAVPLLSTSAERELGVRERLIDAAEQLVAEHGMKAVSSRAIIQAAGQRHNSAITYHFGDRDGLFNAVWSRGSTVVNDRRRVSIAERGATAWTLPALIDVYIAPFAEYLDARRPSYWARFNEEALRHYPLLVVPHLRQQLDRFPDETPLEVLYGLFSEMRRLITDEGQPAPELRVSIMVRAVISTFAAWERDAQADQAEISATSLGAALQATARGILGAD